MSRTSLLRAVTTLASRPSGPPVAPRVAPRVAPLAAPWGLAAAALLAGAAVLPAGAQAETVVEEEEYRDWVHRCEFTQETGEINCFVYTGRVAEHEGEELASRIVVILMHNGDPIVYLDVPDRAEPAAGFQLQIDQRPPFNGLYNDCSTGWCHTQALGDVAVELINQFRAGAEAKVSFVLDREAVRIDLPLSLMGFSAAFARLNEVHAELVAAMLEQQAEAEAAAAAEEAAAEGDGAEDEAAESGVQDDGAQGDGAGDESAGGAGTDDGAAAPDAAGAGDGATDTSEAPIEPDETSVDP